MKITRVGSLVVFTVIVPFALAACGASIERTAIQELEEDGYRTITVEPSESDRNTFSFEAERDDQPCRGEITLQQQMGQTTSTVTSRCEPTSSR